MIVKVEIILYLKVEILQDVINIFKSKNITLPTPEPSIPGEVTINVITPFNETFNYDTVLEIYQYLENELHINFIAERLHFEFSNEDYTNAPFFIVRSTGNSQAMILSDKGTQFKNELFCENCKLIIQHQLSPLVIDTSKIRKRYMVYVKGHWVVSKKMAELMESWGLKGYELREVIHKGPEKGKQQAFQIIAKTFPKWSQEMKIYNYYTDRHKLCTSCGIKGSVIGAYLYNKKDIIDLNNDIYVTAELSHDWKYGFYRTLISKKFRNLLIEHKITKDVRGMYDSGYGPYDWLLDPILEI